ncbi:hypothetical protein DFP95_102153 [Cohnella lupini]|uniref:Uncharacterized protein n=2 Tax=Cohnella lupini TaxID=1294267 RepID=A0A3D9ISJ6_9BACL|nr:hypothetical protein DFP95_102153 [Cohnella lupini]
MIVVRRRVKAGARLVPRYRGRLAGAPSVGGAKRKILKTSLWLRKGK